MKIVNHRLTDAAVTHVISPNKGGMIVPKYLVLHYTAGSDADSSVRHFMDEKAQASAHLVIGRDGKIIQLVDFNLKAWHAGVSAWDGFTGLNSYSIGIELDNAGRLTQVSGRYVSWFQREYPADQVVRTTHKNEVTESFWHAYTEVQIAAALEVARLLVSGYALKEIVGHEDIAPGRKSDPGPAFPMASFKGNVMGRADDAAPDFQVTAELLNIRSGPDLSFNTVALPLRRGARIRVIERQARWAHVQVIAPAGVDGWVRNTYISAA